MLRRIVILVAAVGAFGVLALLLAPWTSRVAAVAPPNDDRANAIALTTPAVSGTVAVADTSSATTEAGEMTSLSGCGGGASNPTISKTIWYT